MEAIEITKVDLITKSMQKKIIGDIIEKVLNGEVDPLKLDIWLKAHEDIIKAIRKNEAIKEITLDEARKYGITFDVFGATVTITNRKKWTYYNDAELEGLEEKAESLNKKIKSRQRKLQVARQSIHGLDDPETGKPLSAPDYKESTFLKIEFKKGE